MKEEKDKLIPRPPVVVVMGHIDHGKSTILDYIRKTSVAEKEEGGITQHISAYEAECEIGDKSPAEKRKITFLDTPGHEAFCSIREYGAAAADIAVLVVSAEDGVKPQTIEALDCINKNSMPFIVALNKIDRPNADIDRAKKDLAENGILVEGWGGTVPIVPISAKTGEGICDLLEMIILQSDVENFRGDPAALGEGFVIESNLNPKQGVSATLIIKNGSLKTGLFVSSPGAYAPIRAIENFRGETISEASFSNPVRIAGWNTPPVVGNQFKVFLEKEKAVSFAEEHAGQLKKEETNHALDDRVYLPAVIKADTFGSLEAIEYELQKLGNEKIAIKVISRGVGAITEKDLKTANIKKCLILGFNVDSDKNAEALALRNNAEIKICKVIYDLVDYAKEKIKIATPVEMVETIAGSAKILRTFSNNKGKQILGGRLEEGEIKSGSTVKIFRRNALIGEGKIKELQVQKIKTGEVREGTEFGMMMESKVEIAEGDILKVTSLVERK